MKMICALSVLVYPLAVGETMEWQNFMQWGLSGSVAVWAVLYTVSDQRRRIADERLRKAEAETLDAKFQQVNSKMDSLWAKMDKGESERGLIEKQIHHVELNTEKRLNEQTVELHRMLQAESQEMRKHVAEMMRKLAGKGE